MPPIRKSSAVDYKWTCGGSRRISHVEVIANGGFGEVHKMLEKSTGEFFARKIIRPLGGHITREDIDNESKAISAICTPGGNKNIVVVRDHNWLPRQPGCYYIDMEYCDETLASRIGRLVENAQPYGPEGYTSIQRSVPDAPSGTFCPTRLLSSGPEIDWESILGIANDMAAGLIYIHARGVVHRDLKPPNVLFSRKDNCWKLADFGSAAQATSKRLNTTRDSRGTAGYRAPETLDSVNPKFNQKSDIFAFGCILYEIVTGQRLFPDDWASLSYSKTGLLPTTVWWPPLGRLMMSNLEYLVASMLQLAPSLRPSSMAVQESLKSIGDFDFNCPTPDSSQAPLQGIIITDPVRRLPFSRELQLPPMSDWDRFSAPVILDRDNLEFFSFDAPDVFSPERLPWITLDPSWQGNPAT